MGYITYKTSDGAPTGSERIFRGTEKKEHLVLSGSEVIGAVVNAVKVDTGGVVTMEAIKQRLKAEALKSNENKIPALTGSGAFTTASIQIKNKFAAYTNGGVVFGSADKTETAIAASKVQASSGIVKEEKKKNKKKE